MVHFTECVDANVTLILTSEVTSNPKKGGGGGGGDPRTRCCTKVLARKIFCSAFDGLYIKQYYVPITYLVWKEG